jgi:uncharacterized protein (DUF2236 family)
MLVGGFAALMLQTLHPQAMAAVDQHSAFREDPFGRLRRTTAFVAVSTFGSTAAFEAAVERVIRIHGRVKGVGPDGVAYEASDPELLTWVHVAEVSSFAAAYQRYGPGSGVGGGSGSGGGRGAGRGSGIGREELDRYFAEIAVIAERLGAANVPKSVEEVEAYFVRMGPQVRATEPSLEAVKFLRRFGENAEQKVMVRILMNGAVGVLPGWARDELRIRRPRIVRELIDRPLMLGAARLLRWACEPSPIVSAARERTAGRSAPAV